MRRTSGVLLLTGLIIFAPASELLAQSPDNVAIVINELSPDSQRIGAYYAKVRGIPAENVLRIQTSTDDAIERDAYVRTIQTPLGKAITRAGLQDQLLFIVLTKGVPLRIAGTTGLQGTLASVDSELTLLYRRLSGQAVPTAGVVENPYFLGTRELAEGRPFSHRDHDIYLVTRLDGYTADDAIALVDRAQLAGLERKIEGKIVLDQRASPPASQMGDEWLERAARRLAAPGLEPRVVLESTPQAARNIQDVTGRYAWGAQDQAQRTRKTGMAFLPGAIAANLASFDARTFRLPPDTWQPTSSPDRTTWFEGSGDGLISDLIREGVTGVSGQVGEALMLGAVRPEVLFPAYLAGFTLAEAFYLATPTLSWQTVVVGDPLAAPFPGRRLTRAELEAEQDPSTGLPAFFGRRRLAIVRAANPDQPEAAVALAIVAETQLALGNTAGAREALVKAIELAPKAFGLLLLLADLDEKAGDYDSAVARYRRILETQPANVVALNNLAYALAVRRNNPAEALPFARKAASLAPRLGTVADTLGWIEHLLGNHDAAAKLFADAVRLEPNNAEIRLHAAIAYAAAGRLEQADIELAQAIRIDPSMEAREEVRRLRTKKGSGN